MLPSPKESSAVSCQDQDPSVTILAPLKPWVLLGSALGCQVADFGMLLKDSKLDSLFLQSYCWGGQGAI